MATRRDWTIDESLTDGLRAVRVRGLRIGSIARGGKDGRVWFCYYGNSFAPHAKGRSRAAVVQSLYDAWLFQSAHATRLSDGRKIKPADARKLTLDDFRHLAKWCDNQRGEWWSGGPDGALTVRQILAIYHAANDAGYAGLDEWHADEPDAASDAYHEIATSAE